VYHSLLFELVEIMFKRLALLSALLSFITGCALVYKQPVFQGNLLDKAQVDQLREGMSQQQVQGLLGSPSVEEPFNQSRWDYVASARRKRGDMEVKNLTVWFNDGAVSKWEGEYFPENDSELAKEMLRFGNLPKDDKKQRRR
jgi:outer membrane protein assembly factor BamE